MHSVHLCIFASGNGSNAEVLMRRFAHHESIQTALVMSNNPHAKVLERAQKYATPTLVVNKTQFADNDYLPNILQAQGITHIVLAGFLWLIPPSLIARYPNRIINIHPSLLPKFGGRGMYGMSVHEAVKAAGEKETGITIHLVNEQYDRGEILFQARVAVADNDTPNTIAEKVHVLEYAHFGEAVERWSTGATLA